MRKRVLVAAALALAACSDGAQPGDVVMQLVTTQPDVAAVSFRVLAAQPNTIDTVVAACGGCSVSLLRISPAEVRGVLVGTALAGQVLRVTVSDVAVPTAYSAQLIEVALSDYSLLPTTGVTLQVVP
jgi:hypothetical protein